MRDRGLDPDFVEGSELQKILDKAAGEKGGVVDDDDMWLRQKCQLEDVVDLGGVILSYWYNHADSSELMGGNLIGRQQVIDSKNPATRKRKFRLHERLMHRA